MWRRGSVVTSWLLDLTASALAKDAQARALLRQRRGFAARAAGPSRRRSRRRCRPTCWRPRCSCASARARSTPSPRRCCRRCGWASAATSRRRRNTGGSCDEGGRFLFSDRLRHQHRRAGQGAGGPRLRFAVRARAHPYSAQPQVALPRRRRAAQALLAHPRSVRGAVLRRGGDQEAQGRHRHPAGAAARADRDGQGDRQPRPALGRPLHLRHRRRLERGRDEQSRRPVRRPLQPDGRLRAGHEGDVDQGRGRPITASSRSSIRSGRGPSRTQKPHPPIILGGESDHTLRRVVDYCDGWFPRTRQGFDATAVDRPPAQDGGEEGPRSQDALGHRVRRADQARGAGRLRQGRHRRRAAGDPRRQPRRHPALSRQDRAARQACRKARHERRHRPRLDGFPVCRGGRLLALGRHVRGGRRRFDLADRPAGEPHADPGMHDGDGGAGRPHARGCASA